MGEGEGGINRGGSIGTHTTICKTEPVGAAACRGLISGPVITQGQGGGRGAKDGGDMCIPAADSLFVHQKLTPHGKAVILQSTKRKKKATSAPRGKPLPKCVLDGNAPFTKITGFPSVI